MPDDLTLGELGRRLDAKFASLKEDLLGLAARLDSKVDIQLLALQQQAQDDRHKSLVEQVAALQRELDRRARDQRDRDEAAERQMRDHRRWLIGAIVIPVIAVLLPLLITRGRL